MRDSCSAIISVSSDLRDLCLGFGLGLHLYLARLDVKEAGLKIL